MSQKKNTNAEAEHEQNHETEHDLSQTGEGQEKGQEQDSQQEMEDLYAEILLSDQGQKLSSKSNGFIYFEIAVHKEDRQPYLRIKGNDGGGLHSKEFILLQAIFDILDGQREAPFKSGILKPAFKGASANNAGFLAGVLRSDAMGLIMPAPNSVFLHVLAPNYDERRATLLALVDAHSEQ